MEKKIKGARERPTETERLWCSALIFSQKYYKKWKKCLCWLSLVVNNTDRQSLDRAKRCTRRKNQIKTERKVWAQKIQGDNSPHLKNLQAFVRLSLLVCVCVCVGALVLGVLRHYPSPLTTCKNRPAPTVHMTTRLPQQSRAVVVAIPQWSLDTANAGSDLCSGGLFGLQHLNYHTHSHTHTLTYRDEGTQP